MTSNQAHPDGLFSKGVALDFAKRTAVLYVDIFHELRREGGRIVLSRRFSNLRRNVGAYVQLYNDGRLPGAAIALGILGETDFRSFNEVTASWSSDEATSFLKEFGNEEGFDALIDDVHFPKSEVDWAEQDERFSALPEDEKAVVLKASSYIWSGTFAQFFNSLAVMAHGVSMTRLVSRAMQGDDVAYLKAVQVDRLLLTYHPYFIDRKQRAQDEGDYAFLRALAYRESNPNLKGKIRFPALYMLFALLELVGWLDKLAHEEILDLCDQAG